MTYTSSWAPYMGSEAVILAIVLVIIAGTLVILGTRMRRTLGATRPGKTVTFFLFVMWILSIVTSTNSVRVYGLAFSQQIASGQIGRFSLPPDRIAPITFTSVLVTFIVILVICRRHGWKMALGNAILGALAAPWIFELPFDLIVVGKTYTPLPVTPFRGLYFLPLLLIEFSTLSLLTLSPLVRLSRATLISLAGMFLVFGIWAAFGFTYPSTPIPIALNAISKVLCFVTVITLFLPWKGNAAQKNVLSGTSQGSGIVPEEKATEVNITQKEYQGETFSANPLHVDPGWVSMETANVQNMIEVKNLTKQFGEVTAVDSLTFHVAKGEVFGLLGPNGAGKTTTIRMLCCLIAKTSGDAQIGGYTVGRAADSLAIRKMIGLVADNVGLYEELSAYDNLDYYGKLYECPEPQRKERIEYYLKMMDLWDKRNLDISDYSKGMKQKIAIARALIHDPELLFLDEPTANLDPESARVVREIILKLKKDGKTIFINTHNLDEAQRICDRIGILKTKLLAVNTPEQLETSTWGTSKTVFQVEQVDDSILEAVRILNPQELSVEDNKIILVLADPLKQNPDVVQQIVSAGGRIQYITQLTPSLEETYIKVIQETK